MTLEDYRFDMASCVRCSSCKWIPFNQMKNARFAKNCPSINRYGFHSYSGSGRINMGLSILDGRSRLTEKVSEVVYACQLCGACDTMCKSYREVIDLTESLLALREKCVEDGQVMIEHLAAIEALKRENNMLGEPKSERGEWAKGLGLKNINNEKADILFHAGCRYSYDKELWPALRSAVSILQEGGLDVGIAGSEESCCGGRAFEMGYRGDAKNFAEDMQARVKASGAKKLVTACSDGFAAFSFLYPLMKIDLAAKPLHISVVAQELLDSGRLRLKNEVPMKVTYHDPCHLGRMSEPFLFTKCDDKRLLLKDQRRTGRRGIYDIPRHLLQSVPGISLVEMDRIRQWSWCCGAGGGVHEAFPEFAKWTALERLEEAAVTGAEVLVTSCPWCERIFMDAAEETGCAMKVIDLNRIIAESAGI